MFPKRFKYTDWDFPVKSAIRRKVSDFATKYSRSGNKYIYENQNKLNEEFSEDTFLDFHNTKDIDVTTSLNEKYYEVLDYIEYIHSKMTDKLKNQFSDWEREFIEVVLELHKYNNEIELNEIMECMGYDKNQRSKFMNKTNILQAKLNKCIEGNLICQL